jgi:hypothetical protein
MSKPSDWLADLTAATADRRWGACPVLLYRFSTVRQLQMRLTSPPVVELCLPNFESRWPNVRWPREILCAPQDWIRRFGRALPDAPEPERNSDAKFLFSLDAFLLAWNNRNDPGILTSSCACGILEAVGARVMEIAGDTASPCENTEGCGCGSAIPKSGQLRDPDSPVERARSLEWQNFLGVLAFSNVASYPDSPYSPSPGRLKADLALWERHAMLLIVPEAAELMA